MGDVDLTEEMLSVLGGVFGTAGPDESVQSEGRWDSETTRTLTRDEVARMASDAERLEYLRREWRTESGYLYGTLERRKDTWWLVEARTAEGDLAVHPFSDSAGLRTLSLGVYVRGTPACAGADGVRTVQGRYSLAIPFEREKNENPLLLAIPASSVEPVVRILPDDVRLTAGGAVDISKTLARAFVEKEHARASKALQEEEERLATTKGQAAALVAKKTETAREVREAEKRLSEADEKVKAAEAMEADLRGRAIAGAEEAAANAERALRAEHHKEKNRLARQLADLETNMKERRAVHQQTIRDMESNAQRLTDYVKAHAQPLVDLGLITEEQLAAVGGKAVAVPDDERDRPEPTDLEAGWAGVVPRVQRYLFESEDTIVYPRDLLESYLALVRTGDFVVLSGLSGSGKTQLVKAFARATGGTAHVVPVKPNWTSSEDLLGYYNPIQRAYLPTPFLDAIVAASRDPHRLHYVCLDEMNLARVEYYFADFLSAMESRGDSPSVDLYSREEAGHVEAEFRAFADVVLGTAGEKLEGLSLGELLRDGEMAAELQKRLGVGSGESLIELHGRLRRMVSGVLNVPSRLALPANLRVVGAVNIDETTHYLSPKVLDRAHVLRFDSPLDSWGRVSDEVAASRVAGVEGGAVRLPAPTVTPSRYPSYDPSAEDPTVAELDGWRREFLVPLGIDFGLRATRQALAFEASLAVVTAHEDLQSASLTHLLRQKVLPRFRFNGRSPASTPVGDTPTGETRLEVLERFVESVRSLGHVGPYDAARDVQALVDRAADDGIVNYWA